MGKVTVQDILARKRREHKKITALTAYDFPFAKLVDEAGIDIVLVGDSLGMVLLGYESTVSVTMAEMVHHLKAVRRAVQQALLVVDMPFRSYETAESALRNAQVFSSEGGAEAVKLEGGARILDQVGALVNAGVPVMGHLGMTPQTISELGGYKVQGRTRESAEQIFEDALALEKAGAFSIVLECVPRGLASRVTEALAIPTIGIGAGAGVDGQILVLYDLLGVESSVHPRFVRRYAYLTQAIQRALGQYRDEVIGGTFPSPEESFE